GVDQFPSHRSHFLSSFDKSTVILPHVCAGNGLVDLNRLNLLLITDWPIFQLPSDADQFLDTVMAGSSVAHPFRYVHKVGIRLYQSLHPSYFLYYTYLLYMWLEYSPRHHQHSDV